jgi:hypothetical protein
VEYILNIEQGDITVSKYSAAMNPYTWDKSIGASKTTSSQTVNANELSKPLSFKQSTDQIETDIIPQISIYNTNDKTKQYSYNLKKCDSCLLFNYIDQTKKDPNVDCTLTYPSKELTKFGQKSEKYESDKVLILDDLNIILKSGTIYFAKHDGVQFIQYDEVSNILADLKDKKIIDIITFERSFELFKKSYILCHTEEEIFVLYKTDKGDYAILHKFNKAEKELKYNSIVSFGATEKELIIIYTGLDFGVAVIKEGKVEKRQILDKDKKLLAVHDAKYSTASDLIFIIVKGKGFYAYNVNDSSIKGIEHPYLTQIDKVAKAQDLNNEVVGVLVDQEQKDIKEILIEFLFEPDSMEINLHKVYTTNGLKFKSWNVSEDFYFLFSKDALYLLPARQPITILTRGTKVSLSKEITSLTIFKTTKDMFFYVLDDELVSAKETESKEFTCKFTLLEKYTVDFLIPTMKGAFIVFASNNLNVGEEEGGSSSLWIILLACGAGVAILIGIAIYCYIRKRNSDVVANNAQLL